MRLTDELLLRFSDGGLDADTAARVSEQLKSDDVARERLRLIELSGKALAEASHKPVPDGPIAALRERILRGDLDGEPPGSERHRAAVAGRRYGNTLRFAAQLAAALALLAAGVLLGALFNNGLGRSEIAGSSIHPAWVVRVVDYHTLYARETVTPSKEPVSGLPQLEARLGVTLRHALHIPDLSGGRLEFYRGQVLRFEETPIVQLVYLPEQGAPLALCITPGKSGDTSPRTSRLRGMGVVRWARANLEYLLVGHQPESELLAVAERVIAQSRS